jgi:bifunctional non-homologous end joining protein LigD
MLNEYNKKRDFSKTPEPSSSKGKRTKGPLSFVIQKHAARRLHYDFRLELDGVLVSWAVPKGPSLDPAEKRLAVKVEDHPLDYAGFEGVIPKGEYGGGEVIVWDRGVFTPDEDDQLSWDDRDQAQQRLRKMIKDGKLSIFLEGEKLRGSWALVKLKGKDNEWLMIKHRDGFTSTTDVTEKDHSVASGRTLADVRSGKQSKKLPLNLAEHAVSEAPKERFPKQIMPMLASLADKPFSRDRWMYEPKLDGIRAIAYVHNGQVQLQSRRGLDLTRQFPTLVKTLSKHKDSMILDGEIVALDQSGKPSFQNLQQRSGLIKDTDIKSAERSQPIQYYVFDILHWGGKNLRSLTLAERKTLLKQAVIPSHSLRIVEAFDADGEEAYKACIENGLEGVVGKRADSPYSAGKRTKDWLKVKGTVSSEFLICGYTEGTGSRSRNFGSLLLGEFNDSGELRYVGGVGTGFNDKTLTDLLQRMGSLETKKCPFGKRPPGKLNPTWVKPQLVAEIKFAERTRDNMLRAPVFLRLREDKSPEETTAQPVVSVETIKQRRQGDEGSRRSDYESIRQGAKAKQRPSHARKDQHDTNHDEAPNAVLDQILDQLKVEKQTMVLQAEGNEISLSNLDKEFWPGGDKGAPVTKRGYIQYLVRVSQYILPHLKDRPLTLVRFPNGISGGKFYQKHVEKGLPPFVETTRFFTEQIGADQDFLMCNNLSTLIWLGQIADLELHTVHTRIDPHPDATQLSTNYVGSAENIESSILNYPDYLVLDLDPYLYSGKEAKGAEPELHREGFKRAAEAAHWLKELLDVLKIKAYVKTSGRTGLHIYVPIVRDIDYATVRGISEVLGRQLLQDHAKEMTMDWAVVKRTGKVFFDHNMNARGKSLASIYSPRVAPEATISTPLEWSELDKVYPTDFTTLTVPQRLAAVGDLWQDILQNKNDLEKLLSNSSSQKQEFAANLLSSGEIKAKRKSPSRSPRRWKK